MISFIIHHPSSSSWKKKKKIKVGIEGTVCMENDPVQTNNTIH